MPLCVSESLDRVYAARGGGGGRTSPQEVARPGGSDTSSPPSSPPTHSPVGSRPPSPPVPIPVLPPRRLLWYPRLLVHLLAGFAYLTWSQLLLIGPTLWVSAWLWVFWKVVQLPLTVLKWVLTALHTPASERARKKRTVLVSGGSTIQALHLARNFYSAGARVVVCEVEGLFGLARFSTAVHKFYTLPRPTSDYPQKYVRALCDIVEREGAAYYIPVCSSTMAYYDGLAKPHLEVLNCVCFCPGVKEIWTLDDSQELFRRCQSVGIATPVYYPLTSRDDLYRLYEVGLLRTGRHFMVNAGSAGCKERLQVPLPAHRHELRLTYDIGEQRPWVAVQDLPGEHFVTCTTVKDSEVVANVTCRVDRQNGGLVPQDHTAIAAWLKNFFQKCRAMRHVTGHLSFRLVVSETSGLVVPLGCRVGVSMPYICYTNVHPRIVWRPCKHFSRQMSGPLVAETGRYWMHEAVINTLKHPSVEAVGRLIGTVLDKREALFVFWDPLPYCAYYHLQLPFKNILGFVQGHYAQNNGRNGFHRTMAAPAH